MSNSNMWLDLKSRVSSVGSKIKMNELFYYFSFSSINSIHLLRAYTINIIARRWEFDWLDSRSKPRQS